MAPHGVYMAYFRHLINACGGAAKLTGLTTADVCHQFLMPLTKATELSVVDHLWRDPNTRHFVAEANWYVSHAWQYLFLETVDSLDAFFALQGIADEDAVLWFCVFNINQHGASMQPTATWLTTFEDALRDIGRLIMVMHPWHSPMVLRRSWCVFELYVATRVHARFEMAMAPQQRRQMLDDMLDGRGIRDMLGHIRSEASATSIPADRDAIFALVRAKTSFATLDRLVFATISHWIKETLRVHIEMLPSRQRRAQSWVRLGNLHEAETKWADAADAFATAVDLYTEVLGPEDDATLAASSQYVSMLAKLGRPVCEWEPRFQAILAAQEAKPENTQAVAATLYRFAVAYEDLRMAGRAIELYSACHEARVRLAGHLHPSTLETVVRLARTNTWAGDLTQADVWVREGMTIARRHGMTLHPTAVPLYSIHAAGAYSRGRPAQALRYISIAHAYYSRVFGADHEETLDATINVATSDRLLRRTRASLARLRQLRDTFPRRKDYPVAWAYTMFSFGATYYGARDMPAAFKYFELWFDLRHVGPISRAAPSMLYHALQYGDPTQNETKRWRKLRRYNASTDDRPETWPVRLCNGCHQPLRGACYGCEQCPKAAYHFCRHCVDSGDARAFCRHRPSVLRCVPPLSRYFLEERLRRFMGSHAAFAATLAAYDDYCTTHKVPNDEKLPRVLMGAAVHLRTWHPML